MAPSWSMACICIARTAYASMHVPACLLCLLLFWFILSYHKDHYSRSTLPVYATSRQPRSRRQTVGKVGGQGHRAATRAGLPSAADQLWACPCVKQPVICVGPCVKQCPICVGSCVKQRPGRMPGRRIDGWPSPGASNGVECIHQLRSVMRSTRHCTKQLPGTYQSH